MIALLKKDDLRYGLAIGFVIPLIGSVFYYLYQFRSVATVPEFIHYLGTEKRLMTAMVSVLLVVNIAMFTYFINSKIDRTAKGIFIATVIYGLASVLWKFVS